jgi:cation diffusion facilitator family transporter
MTTREQTGIRAALLGLTVNAALVVIKVVSGVVGNSYALVADGVESSLDLFSSAVVLRGVTVAGRDPDEDYHFGYGKAESLAGAVVALMLILAALGIGIQAIREILTPHHSPAPFTLLVLILVIAVKEGLFRRVGAVATEIGSLAVRADAWHHRSDALTSGAAFVGISLALIGGEAWASADDWAALGASAIIAANGLRLLRPALDDLMDRAPDPEIQAAVRRAAQGVEAVTEVERIFMRRAGVGYFVALHVHADPDLSLAESHRIGHVVKDAVMVEVPEVLDALIHMEPDGGGRGQAVRRDGPG